MSSIHGGCSDGSKLFYRDKAESWRMYPCTPHIFVSDMRSSFAVRSRLDAADRVWYTLVKGKSSPTMDYRKPLLIYWFMSHIIKCVFSPSCVAFGPRSPI